MSHGSSLTSQQPASPRGGATEPATAIVLAAGEGTRMKSKHAKVAHALLGRPMVAWAVQAALGAGCARVVVVVGSHAQEVRDIVAGIPGVECVEQAERLGTGHAVRVAMEQAGVGAGPVLVLCGDTPLVRAQTLEGLMEAASGQGGGALLTMALADPTGYGRVMVGADGRALRVVEQKDCSPAEAACTTCNAGMYCFDGAALAANIGRLGQENAQHEYYLTDMVELLADAGAPMAAVDCPDADELMGVNSRAQLAQATRAMQRRINRALMDSGVTMMDPDSVWVGPDAQVGRDTELLPGTMLMGRTRVGEDCVVGPGTRLTDTWVGDRCTVDETVAVSARLGDDVDCGPRAYLRAGARLMDGSKAGTHVEIKNSVVGPGSKVPHLSYIGDAQLGADVNIGAGSITCNFDGRDKHRTVIGDGVFVGSDTMMVAPVSIGDGATVGAGSVITHDVPAGALALERSAQRTVPGWLPQWKRDQAQDGQAGDGQTRDGQAQGGVDEEPVR